MINNFRENQFRITALWAFSEAFLGGILHATKVPFSGLLLAAFASICICALALPEYKYGYIIKATMLVIVVKAVLSPVTPLAAYFAVFLQGAFAELIFATGLTYNLSAFLVSIFALLQSALQKIIILTILFGTDFWNAIDQFMNAVTKEMGFRNNSGYSIYIVLIYLGIYLLMGIITGIFAIRLPAIIKAGESDYKQLKFSAVDLKEVPERKTFNNNKILFVIIALAGIILLYQFYSENGIFTFLQNEALKLISRAFIIAVLWLFIVTPLIRKWFNSWLDNKKNKLSLEINHLIQLMPEMKAILFSSWKSTYGNSFLKRINKSIGLIFFRIQKNTGEN